MELFDKKKAGELDKDILKIVPLRDRVKNRDEIINFAVLNYATAGEFDEAFKWYEYIKEDQKVPLDMFNIFASCAIEDKKPETLVHIYDYASEHYEVSSVDYDNAIAAIERYLINESVKETAAKAFTEGRLISGFGDDYIHLWHLRNLIFNNENDDSNDPEISNALNYFLETNKSFSHYYGDVFVAALRQKADFSVFIRNMRITNTIEFIQNIIRSNKDLDDLILVYLKENNYLENATDTKSMRLAPDRNVFLPFPEPPISIQPTHTQKRGTPCEKILTKFLTKL